MKSIENKEIFARNLRHYIELSGKDDKEIAAEVGVAVSTFSEWVRAKKYPRIDKIEMLANIFHIKKSDLIEEKGNSQTASENRARLIALAEQVPEPIAHVAVQVLQSLLESLKQGAQLPPPSDPQ